MSEARLKAKLFVHAALRRCHMEAVPVVVARKGDDDAGTVLVKVNRGWGLADIWTQARDGNGALGWMKSNGPQPVDDGKAEQLIAKARDIDWDLWVLEVDSMSGLVPFIDHVIGAGRPATQQST